MNDGDLGSRLGDNEFRYVKEVLDSGFRSSSGAVMMRRFEEAFRQRFGVRYAISHVNGTATLHSSLEAAGIGIGDEVIVPPLTMSSTAFAVLQANATPVFADVDPDTFVVTADAIASRLTSRTKAVITVALYGLSPDMDPILQLAREHGLTVIEDDAQCLFGRYKGKLVGTLGDAASFSFQSSKHITSGEGGIVITDRQELGESIRRVQSLGYAGVSAGQPKITKREIQDPDYSRHVTLGWNYRMPELCAAVALAQLENADALVARRIHVAELFRDAVSGCEWLVPQKVGSGLTHTYWTYVLRIDHPRVMWHRFRDAFTEAGGDGIYAAWKLTYLEPMFTDRAFLGRERLISPDVAETYRAGLCPVAERLQTRLLQFKTNYWDIGKAAEQAEILKKVARSLS